MLCKSRAQESALSLAADRRTAALLGGTAQRAAVASSLHSLGRSHAWAAEALSNILKF